ncbi:hypothetical protein E2C01_088515 [Portunus trituberculatus]|uniref:Uncharacterized protein n=1 Tax=Portunus trituberculatus TaxID=210409 RepID=A0A5B7JEV8_PORTR|nr:hypothetical protein [Portunus trituberculatus]
MQSCSVLIECECEGLEADWVAGELAGWLVCRRRSSDAVLKIRARRDGWGGEALHSLPPPAHSYICSGPRLPTDKAAGEDEEEYSNNGLNCDALHECDKILLFK